MKLTVVLPLGLLAWLLSAGAHAQVVDRPGSGAATAIPFLMRLPEPGTAARALPADSRQLLRQQLALGPNDELRPLRQETDALGQQHEVFQQYYRGLKVEHGRYTLHRRHGRPELLSGELKRITDLITTPALPEAAARQHAQAAVGASRYQWQDAAAEQQLKTLRHDAQATYFPRGELVVVEDFRQPGASRPLVLAWKFDIHAQQPLSRADVYVDARTGEVVLTNATLKHAAGPAATRFSGVQSIETEPLSGPLRYRLAETTRSRNGLTGSGVQTYNAAGTNGWPTTDFIDFDNNWTAAEYDNAAKDNAALDAHWGAEMTFDYWADIHGRNSYDGAGARLVSFVHYDSTPGDGVGMNNAFWDGSAMSYGDGSSLRPFTVLDVCGHEIGHAVCQATADLVYQNESGALNEGFSDIWGACVERYALGRVGPLPGKLIWTQGEDLGNSGTGLRSMNNPNAGGSPDTYGGSYWVTGTYDGGGVHINSGVLNFWFYLLNEGGSGTNDIGFDYAVTGISPSGTAATINDAARIAFRAERLYLTPNATFAQARLATLQAATDLFGAGSGQVTQVGNAWDAVGVRDASVAVGITSFSPTQAAASSAATVTITGTNFTYIYSVTFNGVNAPGFVMVNSTTITVPLPAGTTTGKIMLFRGTGRAISSTDFVVNTGPLVTSIAPPAGPVGQTVSISGQNFVSGATTVRIGGVAATSVSVSSATALTAVVGIATPAGPQPVVVTTAPGDSNPTVLYTVVVPPPTMAAFSPASGPPVGGGTLLITGTNFGSNPVAVTVAGLPATGVTVLSATQLRATLPPGAAGLSGPVVVTTPGGAATSAATYAYLDVLSIAYFEPAAAVAGSTVTLYGAQLAGTTGVSVNGAAVATILSSSATTVRFVVPAGAAATGLTTLTTPTGTVTSPDFGVLLTLTGRSPARNGQAAPRESSAVSLTFSEPVTAATVAGIKIISTQRGGRRAGTWSSGGSTCSFAATAGNPRTDFLPGETVRVSVPGTVAGTGGVAVAPQVYQFTTATGGTGRGTFHPGAATASDGNGLITMLGDLDGDGDLDLMLVSAGANTIKTQLNGGNASGSNTGVFSNGANYTGGLPRPNAAALGDVDGDGDLDLLTTCNAPSRLRVDLNNGNGTFTPGATLSIAFRVFTLAVGDLDGDGDLDVLTNTDYLTTITFCRNDGSGNFSVAANIPTVSGVGNLELGDLDGDGDLDIAGGVQQNGDTRYEVVIHLNGGDNTGRNQGTFPTQQRVPVLAANCRALLGDVDGDGDLDLLGLGVSGGRVSLRLNGGDNTGSNTGNFLNGAELLLPPTAANYWSGSLADMDADGDLDLVLPSIGDRALLVLLNGSNALGNGGGTFGPALSYPFSSSFSPYYAALGDVDGDGDLDAVVTDVNNTPVNILLNGPATPLPVELTAFRAKAEGAAVQLRWTTASECRSAYFEVERSADGRAFEPQGRVAARGRPEGPATYAFRDDKLPPTSQLQLHYYRLRQVDSGGEAWYSPVRAVSRPAGAGPAFSAFPNPAHSTVQVELHGLAGPLRMCNALGQQVRTTPVTPGATSVELSLYQLPTGLYMLWLNGHTCRLLVE